MEGEEAASTSEQTVVRPTVQLTQDDYHPNLKARKEASQVEPLLSPTLGGESISAAHVGAAHLGMGNILSRVEILSPPPSPKKKKDSADYFSVKQRDKPQGVVERLASLEQMFDDAEEVMVATAEAAKARSPTERASARAMVYSARFITHTCNTLA